MTLCIRPPAAVFCRGRERGGCWILLSSLDRHTIEGLNRISKFVPAGSSSHPGGLHIATGAALPLPAPTCVPLPDAGAPEMTTRSGGARLRASAARRRSIRPPKYRAPNSSRSAGCKRETCWEAQPENGEATIMAAAAAAAVAGSALAQQAGLCDRHRSVPSVASWQEMEARTCSFVAAVANFSSSSCKPLGGSTGRSSSSHTGWTIAFLSLSAQGIGLSAT